MNLIYSSLIYGLSGRYLLPLFITASLFAECKIAPIHHNDGILDSSGQKAKIIFIPGKRDTVRVRAWINLFGRHPFLWLSDTIQPIDAQVTRTPVGWKADSTFTYPSDMTIQADQGEKMSILLEDSSVVLLNSGSSLFHSAYLPENKRENYLSGEGVFTVKPGKKPLILHFDGDQQLSVDSGTFSVINYPEDSVIKITSATSLVHVEDHDLFPGEEFFVDPATRTFRRVKADTFSIQWLDRDEINFDRETRLQLLHRIGRWYGVKVFQEYELGPVRVSGALNCEKIDSVAKRLAMMDIQASVRGDTLFVRLLSNVPIAY